ncbi:hypothetical protein CBL_06113 [Carabus blaptoides fortunei]
MKFGFWIRQTGRPNLQDVMRRPEAVPADRVPSCPIVYYATKVPSESLVINSSPVIIRMSCCLYIFNLWFSCPHILNYAAGIGVTKSNTSKGTKEEVHPGNPL